MQISRVYSFTTARLSISWPEGHPIEPTYLMLIIVLHTACIYSWELAPDRFLIWPFCILRINPFYWNAFVWPMECLRKQFSVLYIRNAVMFCNEFWSRDRWSKFKNRRKTRFTLRVPYFVRFFPFMSVCACVWFLRDISKTVFVYTRCLALLVAHVATGTDCIGLANVRLSCSLLVFLLQCAYCSFCFSTLFCACECLACSGLFILCRKTKVS